MSAVSAISNLIFVDIPESVDILKLSFLRNSNKANKAKV